MQKRTYSSSIALHKGKKFIKNIIRITNPEFIIITLGLIFFKLRNTQKERQRSQKSQEAFIPIIFADYEELFAYLLILNKKV